MKRPIPIFLIAFLLLCSGSAFSYEIRISASIPLADKFTGIAVNTSTGVAAVVSGTKNLYLVDTNSNSVIKTIPLAVAPSAVAIEEKTNPAVVFSHDGILNFIELDSGSLTKTIVTGKAIYSVALDKDTEVLYLGTGDGVTIMDLMSGAILKEVPLSHKVIGMGMDNTLGYLVIAMEGKDGIILYDVGTMEFMAEIGTGRNPSGVSVNPSTHIAMLTNESDNSLSVISLESKSVLDTIPFGKPNSIAIDPTRNMALIGNKDGIAVVQLENPVPAIESLIPESSNAGSPGFSLSIKGSRFVRDSSAMFDLTELDTLFGDNNNLKALVLPEELSYSRDVPVTVVNPQPGGGMSNSVLFRVINPVPRIESITPAEVALSSPAASVRVRGGNFLPNSIVNLNGKNLTTKFISSILLEAQLDLTVVNVSAQYPVTVINPSPVSLASNVAFLNIAEDESGLSTSKGEDTLKEASAATTGTLKGRILDTQRQPIEGVTVQVKNVKAKTDPDGYFILNNVPSGKRQVMIHGPTASDPNRHYPTIPLTVNIQESGTTEMPFQIYLHQQKNWNFKEINPEEDTVLTDPEYPGFELRIPKGVKITGWDGKPNQRVSVRTVPPDRLPVKPLPQNAFVKSVYMFYFDKLGGGVPDRPIPVKAPNDLGLLPGEKAVLWYYDESPNEGEAPNDWAIAGTGTVTPDGRYIVSDPGVGIPKFCCGAMTFGGSGSGSGPSGPDGCGRGMCCLGGSGGSGGDDGGGSSGPGPGGPSGNAGDPVDLATGYFIYRHTDYKLQSIISVNITRHYRSGDSGLGGYGTGTYFGYDWWIGDYGNMLLLLIPGNYQYKFYQQPDGTFTNSVDPAYAGDVFYKNSGSTYTLKKKSGWNYNFDSNKLLVQIIDPNGNVLTLLRGNDTNVSQITTPDGKVVTLNLHGGGGPSGRDIYTSISGSNGTVTYNYTSGGQLASVTYPDGSSINYQYDSNGRMATITENGNLVVANVYDANNRVIQQTHSDGGTYTFNYTVAGGYVTQTSMTAPNGAVTTWRFNSYGYITDKTMPDGTTTYARDPGTNQILSVTDPLGRTMSYTYDTKGRATTVTDNVGNTTTYQYEDAHSKIAQITDALGNVTTMTYDQNGNMASRTTPDNKTTTFTYNTIGKPLTVTDPMNHVTTMAYDTSGNLTRVTDALGNFSIMTYDNLNRLSTMTDANGKTTTYNYDVMGRMTSVTDPLGNITNYGYNFDGKLTAVADAKNREIRYDHDSRKRLISMTDQLGNIETYTYDTSDNLTSVTDRKGQVTMYTYDLMNRLTQATYTDSSSTSYTYDATGKVLSITDSVSGTISYTYTTSGCGTGTCGGSAVDKVASETTPLGSISYSYDAIGRRTSMTVAGQPAVNYGYDAGGRLNDTNTLINGVVQHFAIGYDGLGRRASLTLPNGVTTSYAYDIASHLLNMQHMNPAQQVFESPTYTYDAAGNRISMTRATVTLPLPNQVANTSYNDANQMLSFNDKSMTYDANGNMTSVTNTCGTTTFTWDVRNRLVGIIGFKPDCTVLTANFMYDALGRRIAKTINGTTIQYLYDGLDIVQEIENGLPSVNYIRTLNIDEPLLRIEACGRFRYYQADALGNVIALTDENGAVKTTYSYDPFGNVTIAGEASDNSFQYTGRENDGTGLYYYRARYYSSELQRFISEDPIGIKGGINLYSYVKNNPVNHKDRYGLFTDPGNLEWRNPPNNSCPNKKCDGTWVGEAAYSTFIAVGCTCYWWCTNWGNSIHMPDPHKTPGFVNGDDCECPDPNGETQYLPLRNGP